jgi:hypothetical protein
VQSPTKGLSARLKAHDTKGKAPKAFVGSRPKFVFEPKLQLLGSHLKKGSGLGQPSDPGALTSAGGNSGYHS